MKAAEIMTSNVITIAPDASVRDLARVLLTKGIGAVPVVDDHCQFVGIVSEGDLIRRADAGTEQRRSWRGELNAAPERVAAEFVKPHARTVSDIMTRNVVAAGPDTQLSEIAALLEDHDIKRAPIVVQGKVVGIVSRADFLRVLADLRREDVDDASDDTVQQDHRTI